MDANAVVTLVQTIGFPVVMCGAMAYYVKYITDRNREDLAAERSQHDAEMNKITEAIKNNTIALQKLTDYMEVKNVKRD